MKTQWLLDRLAGLLRGEVRSQLATQGLQPVQFEALQYLASCNRYSDTPMAVTEFLGQTKGTVSQSLKVLEKHGLVTKFADSKDKRIAHIRVTAQGHNVLRAALPSQLLLQACEALPAETIEQLNQSLSALLLAAQRANGFKTFGQCRTCIHNRTVAKGIHCALTNEALSAKDVTLICREHELPPS